MLFLVQHMMQYHTMLPVVLIPIPITVKRYRGLRSRLLQIFLLHTTDEESDVLLPLLHQVIMYLQDSREAHSAEQQLVGCLQKLQLMELPLQH